MRPSCWRRAAAPRRAQDVTTGARISAETSAAPGSSSPAHDPSAALFCRSDAVVATAAGMGLNRGGPDLQRTRGTEPLRRMRSGRLGRSR
jgi:hypothetical protein